MISFRQAQLNARRVIKSKKIYKDTLVWYFFDKQHIGLFGKFFFMTKSFRNHEQSNSISRIVIHRSILLFCPQLRVILQNTFLMSNEILYWHKS